MADRTCLEIDSGERDVFRVEWDDEQLGSSGPLGALEWSLVVLDDLTVDVEVSVQLAAGPNAEPPGVVVLQEASRGRSFRGVVDPTADPLLLKALTPDAGDNDGIQLGRLRAVIFDCSNEFSWFTQKQVEIMAVRTRPDGPPRSKVPPLSPLQPLNAVPRSSGCNIGVVRCDTPPSLTDPAPREEADCESTDALCLRFVTRVDDCLLGLENELPEVNESLQSLVVQMASLRAVCKGLAEDYSNKVAMEDYEESQTTTEEIDGTGGDS